MALTLNNHPKCPKGPERDNITYTNKPTTTDGIASIVFNTANTPPRPRNRATASQAPSKTPNPLAKTVATPLTHSDRPTIDHKAPSPDAMSEKAVVKDWVMEFMQEEG
jgi:hypothetical protein